ncbi:sensor histidine kinase, partial [Roseomonas sp. KE2513]|nr:sensor histidine kinase [Roseomonas sp. KE2513]
MSGLIWDITERKIAEEQQALLAREVDHRAKNALAVVQAALRLTKASSLPEYIAVMEGRVSALARAQTLLARDRWSGADLRTLLDGELAPFLGSGQRALLDGPAVMLPAHTAQPLAMTLHELATNAVKYGALSSEAGHVSVTWTVEEMPSGVMLRLRWTEVGGPPLSSPPRRMGFGSRVLEGTIRS